MSLEELARLRSAWSAFTALNLKLRNGAWGGDAYLSCYLLPEPPRDTPHSSFHHDTTFRANSQPCWNALTLRAAVILCLYPFQQGMERTIDFPPHLPKFKNIYIYIITTDVQSKHAACLSISDHCTLYRVAFPYRPSNQSSQCPSQQLSRCLTAFI